MPDRPQRSAGCPSALRRRGCPKRPCCARIVLHENPVEAAPKSGYAGAMDQDDSFDIFLVAPPGLEPFLAEEAREKGFAAPVVSEGGVTVRGGWPEVWRANLELRGTVRVLARIGAFRAMHLAQLDKRARKFPWAEVLRSDQPVRVEASCRASRIYHAGAAAQRVATAIAEELGAPVILPGKGRAAEDEAEEPGDAGGQGGAGGQGSAGGPAPVAVKLRIEDDLCTISLDSSGEPLHRRGHKQAVNKAPMRETMAALFLRACGYDGTGAVLDPMCGSGTFPIEAAEIAAGLFPGRSRGFAFERLANFDPAAWAQLKAAGPKAPGEGIPGEEMPGEGMPRFFGSDRDAGAIRMSRENAARAGVAALTAFETRAVSDLAPPEGVAPGLVIVNPPYGARIGNPKLLYGLYGALGQVLKARFAGWRVGLVTSEAGLARATGLPFLPPGPAVPHGGLRVTLYRTAALG